jgi:hypothetical protein
MTFEGRCVSAVIERILPPVMLAGLLVFQLTHLSLEGVRARVPLYSGTYVVSASDRPFLPNSDEMKRLAIRVGTRQGLRLNDQNVDVGIVLNMLRVTVRADGDHDWEQFFVNYHDELRRAALARCERARIGRWDMCVSDLQMPFQGWSASRGSWIKPLDLLSMMVLAIALGMWFTGRRPGGAS